MASLEKKVKKLKDLLKAEREKNLELQTLLNKAVEVKETPVKKTRTRKVKAA